MISKKTLFCTGERSQNHKANIVAAFGKNTIFVRCNHQYCRRWVKIRVNLPGINLNFHKAGLTQELLPADYHLDLEPATVVMSDFKRKK